MKLLLIVTEKLPVPPIRGGAIQTYIDAVAPLVATRHDLTILGVTDPDLPAQERAGAIRFVRVPGGLLERYQEGVTGYLRENQFDLIQIYNRPRLVLPVREAAPGARLMLSLHNEMFAPEKIGEEEGRAALTELQKVITVSHFVGRRVQERFPEVEPKLRTIYSGVDLTRFVPPSGGVARRVREELRRTHGLTGRKVILFVGRLSPKKGADVLVRAMPALARAHPDAALVLVGSRWYSEDRISDYVAYVRALAARSPIPVVTTGYVPAADVHQWFWTGDLFVCPSLWEEPLARVHYEAMATGLPIITSRRGGNPEVVEGTGCGLVVDQPDEPRALAAAISGLLESPGRREQMGRAGRTLAERRFGWARVAGELLETWER